MIQVVRIAGDGFDLTTGQEVPRTLVLSNGRSECAVPVSEETLTAILGLYAEDVELAEGTPRKNGKASVVTHSSKPKPKPKVNGGARLPQPEEMEEEDEPDSDYDSEDTGVASV